jgi:hypothetical protein
VAHLLTAKKEDRITKRKIERIMFWKRHDFLSSPWKLTPEFIIVLHSSGVQTYPWISIFVAI